MHHGLTLSLLLLTLVGCANREGYTPSQNPSLLSISPNTAVSSEGGAMQRGLDSWLKEEWIPLTTPAQNTQVMSAESSSIQTSNKVVTVASEPEDNTPFSLQKLADKWKIYEARKAELNEGKQKKPSHVEELQALPVIGK